VHRLVELLDVAARPTAVVAATTTWRAFPALWPQLSDEVWACLRANGISGGCPNVMLYRDGPGPGEVRVEVGVELRQPCELTGRVFTSTLPGGRVAMTVHHGPWSELGSAHQAIADWCATEERQPTGTRWEIYGPHRDDPAELWTEVYWLLEPPRTSGGRAPGPLVGR
jgi:effector-binding domain-containing protein